MTSRRVLLIEPPFYRLFDEHYSLCRYPLSLAYLAASVAAHTDWQVRCYNSDFAGVGLPFSVRHLSGAGHRRYLACLADPGASIWREVEGVLREQAPAVVGISLKSATLAAGRMLARIAKRLNPDCLVLAGGPHPTAAPQQVLAGDDFDLCVVGEGEHTLVELLRRLQKGEDVSGVPGVAAKGRPITPRQLAADLDELPRPGDWARTVLLDHERYPAKALGHLMATRGCPQRCTYCGSHNIWGRRPRYRSPGHVVSELLAMQAAVTERVHFDDDTFGIEPGYLRGLCRAIADSCPGLGWSCETHVRLITEPNLESMQRAGCQTIQLGIESGSERILRSVRKGFGVADAREACRMVKRRGMRLEVFIMAGFPQETEETLRETKALVQELECDKVIFSLFTPHPGTADHRICLERGLLPPGYDFSLHHHQSPGNYFSPGVAPALFRELVDELEQLVQTQRDQTQSGS